MLKEKVTYLVYIFLIGIFAVSFMVYKSFNNKQESKEKFKNYVQTTGKVIDKKISSSGGKIVVSYTVSFKDKNGKEYIQSNSDIGESFKSYEKNDTVGILYNPDNPLDPIIEKLSLESDSFSANNSFFLTGIFLAIILIAIIYKKYRIGADQ
jgi:hypothetical protein